MAIQKYAYTAVIEMIDGVPALTIPDIPVIGIAGADTVTMILEAEERLRKYLEKLIKENKKVPDRNTLVTDYMHNTTKTAYDIIVYIQVEDKKAGEKNEKVN